MPSSPQRASRINAIREHYSSHILMIKEELELFFSHPVGIAADKSYFDAVEDKVIELAEYEGALEALDKHFS